MDASTNLDDRLALPLVERIGAHVMAGRVIHADDIPVPVLAPGADQERTAMGLSARRAPACRAGAAAFFTLIRTARLNGVDPTRGSKT